MNEAVTFSLDKENIAHIILDKVGSSTNLMDAQFEKAFKNVVDNIARDDSIIGVIVRSKKSTFFAGGDLDLLSNITEKNAASLMTMIESIKKSFRTLETLNRPVVACLNGAALGGGWEVALSCHYRVALNDGKNNSQKKIYGLPEVTLGLLPGAGGITRTIRLLGIERSLPFLTEGKRFSAIEGLSLGLIHEVVSHESELLERARIFIQTNTVYQQPWDKTGYRIPGGTPSDKSVTAILPIAPAIIQQHTKGVFPAPKMVLNTIIEGAQVDFDTALRIESRYFVKLASGQICKNMISTFWFEANAIKSGAGRPKGFKQHSFSLVGIVGAGRTGAAIAYVTSKTGINVILSDVTNEKTGSGKDYSENILSQLVAKNKISEASKKNQLDAIIVSHNTKDLQHCDLVIEAVDEDRKTDSKVSQDLFTYFDKETVFASNRTTFPITSLAINSPNPENFIGLHFFSSVDKIQLVEIIKGELTSEETLAKAYDFVIAIGKTPIIVNDNQGFFTPRVFSTFINEGMAMLTEGVAPASIENGALLSGFPAGPLAISDEISLSLIANMRHQTIVDLQNELGTRRVQTELTATDGVIEKMLALGRFGKKDRKGFYDYPAEQKKHLWTGLNDYFPQADHSDQPLTLKEIKDRLLFIMTIESLRCLNEQVLSHTRDANIASILGLGFPSWTGGVIQFIKHLGEENFIDRSRQLEARYGTRFSLPQNINELLRTIL